VTVTLERGESTIVFKGVPAQVCENCGEQYVDESVSSDLLKQAQAAVGNGVQVEVRSFAA
jgi:YgiT-type zinc finger domain-containing protein